MNTLKIKETKFIQTSFEALDSEINKISTDLILFIVDQNVYDLYSDRLHFLQSKSSLIWIAPAGEESKTIENYNKCLNYFLQKGIHREAHLIAIGGGATSDFAGFISATILRGISWSVIPTTLLSLVDASIGGKVGINSSEAKNQIGAFWLPQNVFYVDTFLSTLDKQQVFSGYGEIIKYAFLSKDIYNLIEQTCQLQDIIYACVKYKQKIIKIDPFEKDIRKTLNLGHTFGHCLERIKGIEHGIAVIYGMQLLFAIFKQSEEIFKLESMIKYFKINNLENIFEQKIPLQKFFNILSKDKKIKDEKTIELIIAKNNKFIIKEFDLLELKKLVCQKFDSLEIVKHTSSVEKKISVPTSKSYANRILILSAIAERKVTISNLPSSTDVTTLLDLLTKIGLKIIRNENQIIIENSFPQCEQNNVSNNLKTDHEIILESKDGGTTNRFLISLLALGKNKYIVRPSLRMNQRPMKDLFNALRSLGCSIVERNSEWEIKGKGLGFANVNLLTDKQINIDCSKSTQFASSLLMIQNNQNYNNKKFDLKISNLKSSKDYIEITKFLIQEFVSKFKGNKPLKFNVPIDASSLSYPLAASSIFPVCIEPYYLDLKQPDSIFLKLLKEMGSVVSFKTNSLKINSFSLRAIDVDCSDFPDLVPSLVFVCSYAKGKSILRNLSVLKHKESDRIKELLYLLDLFKIKHKYQNDNLHITGKVMTLNEAVECQTFPDHRMAMIGCLFLLKNQGGILHNISHVKKSFPDFFKQLVNNYES